MDSEVIYLYPRLPHAVAVRDAGRKQCLPLDQLRDESTVKHPDSIFTATGGTWAPEEHLAQIQAAVRDCAHHFGYPESPSVESRVGFDAMCARALHRSLNTRPSEAAKPDLWQFFTCVMAPDVVRWRFPGKEDGTALERFLGGVRNVFQRLWWRAEVLTVIEIGDPLDLLGEDELVQVMERPRLAGNRRLNAMVVEELLKVSEDHALENRSETMRQIQRRLVRLAPFVSFHALQPGELRILIKDVARSVVGDVQEPPGEPEPPRGPKPTVWKVLWWADCHKERTGEWPSSVSGPIEEAKPHKEDWGEIDSALRLGYRGLPGGSSLAKLLDEHRRKKGKK